MSTWKQKTLSRVLCLTVLFSEKTVKAYIEYLHKIATFSIEMELKHKLILSVLEALMLQVASWTRFPLSCHPFVPEL